MTEDELIAEGRRAWPQLAPDPPVGAVLAQRAAGRPIEEVIDSLDAAEVFLAAALLAGDPAAPGAFEERYFDAIDGALARIRASRDEIAEVRQLMRARLLLPREDGTVPLVDYCGAGRLGGLLRVSAMRALFNMRAKQKPSEDPDEALAQHIAAELDPQTTMLGDEERVAVATSIRDAARALGSRARSLLRFNLIDGMSIDELGRVFGVHRATAARQLARAREDLVAGVRERLVETWGERAETWTLVSTHLDITLSRLLATTNAG